MTNEPYFLFLDDERVPSQVTWVLLPQVTWTIVRSYRDFVSTILKRGYLPTHISFDHDLGVEMGTSQSDTEAYNLAVNRLLHGQPIDYDKVSFRTGYHCAQWLVNYCLDHNLPCPSYTVHSMNPVGAANIHALFAGAFSWEEGEDSDLTGETESDTPIIT